MPKLRLFAAITLLGISAICNSYAVLADTPIWDSGKSFGYRFEGLGPYVRARLGLSVGGANGLPDVMAEIEPVPLSHGVYSQEVSPAYGPDGTRPMPSIYMAHVLMGADGQPFARAELHARVQRYAIRLPYAPHEIMLEVGLNNGRTAQQKAKLGEKLPLRYDADLRAGVADSMAGVTVDPRSSLLAANLFYTCQVPASSAPIKRIQLWLGQHPFFAPEAPLLLTDTQVVAMTRWLSFFNQIYLELPRRGPLQDSRALEFTVTCEMQDGRKITGVATAKIPQYSAEY